MKKFNLEQFDYSNYEYIDRSSSDYVESKNRAAYNYLKKQCQNKIDFSTMTFEAFLAHLNQLHKIIGADCDQQDRKHIMNVLNHDYELLTFLNYQAGVSSMSKEFRELYNPQGNRPFANVHLAACGYPEQAKSIEKTMYNKQNLSGIVMVCLVKYPPEKVLSAIQTGTLKRLCTTLSPNDIAKAERARVTEPQLTKKALGLASYSITPKNFAKLRENHAPVYFLFSHPRDIHSDLERAFNQLKKSLKQAKNTADKTKAAVKIHSDYIMVHPKVGSTKRVARALMNLILMSCEIPPLNFRSQIEIVKYTYNLQEYTYHTLASPKLRSKFSADKFQEFILRKQIMPEAEFQKWCEHETIHQAERGFRVALEFYGSAEKLLERCKQEKLWMPSPDFVDLRAMHSYAITRAETMIEKGQTTASEKSMCEVQNVMNQTYSKMIEKFEKSESLTATSSTAHAPAPSSVLSSTTSSATSSATSSTARPAASSTANVATRTQTKKKKSQTKSAFGGFSAGFLNQTTKKVAKKKTSSKLEINTISKKGV